MYHKEGAAFIQLESGLNPRYGELPMRKFAGLPSDIAKIVAEYKAAGNDIRVLNERLSLGMSETDLIDAADMRILHVKIAPSDPRFHFSMPNGNEIGAYPKEWVPGGFTKGGAKEIAIEGAEKIQHNGDIDSLKAHFTESEYL